MPTELDPKHGDTGKADEGMDILNLTGGRWEATNPTPLTESGQANVYLVRSAKCRETRKKLLAEIHDSLFQVPASNNVDPQGNAARLVGAMADLAKLTRQEPEGALKLFKTRPGSNDEDVMARFKAEVEILHKLKDDSIVALLDSSVPKRWMVTEFQHGGTLESHRKVFVGRVLESLIALRPLVRAVARLHAVPTPIVHRDIKPANIFVSAERHLVLGDFGIAFTGTIGDRVTHTQGERVGPWQWMPQWANTGERLEEVPPAIDVYMLGKVLWWMISGKDDEYWRWETEDAFNLAKLFPDDPAMEIANGLLRVCYVETRKRCLPSAKEMLAEVDKCIELARGERLSDTVPRSCLVCHVGRYRETPQDEKARDPKLVEQLNLRGFDGERLLPVVPRPALPHADAPMKYFDPSLWAIVVRVRYCDRCGHVQFFMPGRDGKVAPAWQ